MPAMRSIAGSSSRRLVAAADRQSAKFGKKSPPYSAGAIVLTTRKPTSSKREFADAPPRAATRSIRAGADQEPPRTVWRWQFAEVDAWPSEGVAPLIVEQMANMILELKREGLSILLSEQNFHFAELGRDRAYVLEKGQIRYGGAMCELARDDGVRRAYLG